MWIFFQHSLFGKRRALRSLARSRGFTLVELLVVISIMLILTSVFLLRQQRFNSSTLLRSLSYSVALSVRQAQVYGTSIRESSLGAFDSGSGVAKAYGVYFASGSAGSYLLFADTNNDGRYTSGEEVQTFNLSTGYTIKKFCATTVGSTPTERCSSAGTITNLTILFKRPNPDACIATSFSSNACTEGASPAERYSSAYVQLISSSDTRSVNVTITGQITVGAQGS